MITPLVSNTDFEILFAIVLGNLSVQTLDKLSFKWSDYDEISISLLSSVKSCLDSNYQLVDWTHVSLNKNESSLSMIYVHDHLIQYNNL